jgi:hypothetical protein
MEFLSASSPVYVQYFGIGQYILLCEAFLVTITSTIYRSALILVLFRMSCKMMLNNIGRLSFILPRYTLYINIY